jgi:hypothetical protein
MTIEDVITTDGYLEFCKKNNICYVKTDYFYINSPFLWRGRIHPTELKSTCIIGHSDYPVTESISSKFDKVFCINKDNNCENTYGIPLGLGNDCDDSPLHRIYGNKEIVIEIRNSDYQKENLAYMNFNINNHSDRKTVWETFNNKEWVKTADIENTIDGRKRYLKDIKKSNFVICPRGNGIDTHRLWETLYVGSIPVVKYENAHHLFTDLPILFINDWNEVTKEFLEFKYEEIVNKEWNLEKLKISYWLEFIKNKIII